MIALILAEELAESVAVTFNSPPVLDGIDGHFGSVVEFTGDVRSGSLGARETDRYTFVLRDIELNSLASGALLLGVRVDADGFVPGAVTLDGAEAVSVEGANGVVTALFSIV